MNASGRRGILGVYKVEPTPRALPAVGQQRLPLGAEINIGIGIHVLETEEPLGFSIQDSISADPKHILSTPLGPPPRSWDLKAPSALFVMRCYFVVALGSSS